MPWVSLVIDVFCMTVQGRIFLAPFWHVNFADFWIADQMNSLAVVFLDLEYFLCFLAYGLHFEGKLL